MGMCWSKHDIESAAFYLDEILSDNGEGNRDPEGFVLHDSGAGEGRGEEATGDTVTWKGTVRLAGCIDLGV